MKRILRVLIGAIMSSYLLSSCISMSSMQTARTMPKGEFGGSGGIGFVQTELRIDGVDTIKVGAPFLEAAGRYGIKNNWDVGLKLTIIGTVMADTKYRFIGSDSSLVSGSAGIGLGYMSSGVLGTTIKSYDGHVPLYFSIHPTNWLGFYANPRYVLRMNTYTSDLGTSSFTNHWYGATGGVRLGRETAFLMEYSYFKSSNYGVPLTQFTCGVAIGIR